MIIFKDMTETALADLIRHIGNFAISAVDVDSDGMARVKCKDEVTICYKAGGAYLIVEYQKKRAAISLNEFSTVEIV